MHPLRSEPPRAEARRVAHGAGQGSLHSALSWLLLPLLVAQQHEQLLLTLGQLPPTRSDAKTRLEANCINTMAKRLWFVSIREH